MSSGPPHSYTLYKRRLDRTHSIIHWPDWFPFKYIPAILYLTVKVRGDYRSLDMNFIFLALWLFGGQSEGWRAQCVCVEQWPKAKQAPPWSLDFYRNRKCCAARVIENSGLMVGGPIISPLKAYHHFPNTSTIPRIMHRAYHFKCLRIFLNEILVEKIEKDKSSRFLWCDIF